jgi:ATP-dependent DNA ligase
MPRFTPMPLRRMREPFDHADWLYELKYDGFRALAFVRRTGVELVSRNGNRFRQFAALFWGLTAAILFTSLETPARLNCPCAAPERA